MVTIRLARGGSKKRPFYHLVATDSRKPRDSGYIEQLGFFNPGARGQEVRLNIKQDRVDYWISKGAQPSDRVASLLKEATRNPAADADSEGAAA
jgi:small subunit ribosomal protein S16